MFCGQCGKENPTEHRFCSACGRPLVAETSRGPASDFPAGPPQVSEPLENVKYTRVWKKILNSNEVIHYEFSVGERYRYLCLISGTIMSLLFFKVAVWLGATLLLGVLFYYGFYIRAANAYAFTSKRVLVHHGWLSTTTISIDYAKITDVVVHEKFLDRLTTQTGHLGIDTAGTGEVEVILKNIEKPYETKKKLDSLRS